MLLRPSAKEPGRTSARYLMFRRLVILLGKAFLGFDVHGEENVPERGALIVAANHSRFFDPVFVCMAVSRRLQWMAKKELFVFGLRSVFRVLGAFPVDRGGGGRAAIRAALDFLADGWAISMFPEGTRGKGGVERRARSGVIMIAVRSGAPILPVYVDHLPTPAERLRGKRFDAYVGETISLDKDLRGRDAYREAAEKVMQSIYSLPDKAP